MTRARVHQHVNPLAKFYRELPVEPLDTASVFEYPEFPIHIDIGCGRGRFLLEIAQQEPNWNYLGLEIREPLVEEANAICARKGLNNLHYSFCNAPLDLGKLLTDVPNEKIKLVTIQFPDPWFKKRHAKRRMVNEQLVGLLNDNLSEDGKIFVQTDVEDSAAEITEHFVDGGYLVEEVESSILPVKTEREISVEKRGLDVYRMVILP